MFFGGGVGTALLYNLNLGEDKNAPIKSGAAMQNEGQGNQWGAAGCGKGGGREEEGARPSEGGIFSFTTFIYRPSPPGIKRARYP